jgi:hypothetical protein
MCNHRERRGAPEPPADHRRAELSNAQVISTFYVEESG